MELAATQEQNILVKKKKPRRSKSNKSVWHTNTTGLEGCNLSFDVLEFIRLPDQ